MNTLIEFWFFGIFFFLKITDFWWSTSNPKFWKSLFCKEIPYRDQRVPKCKCYANCFDHQQFVISCTIVRPLVRKQKNLNFEMWIAFHDLLSQNEKQAINSLIKISMFCFFVQNEFLLYKFRKENFTITKKIITLFSHSFKTVWSNVHETNRKKENY